MDQLNFFAIIPKAALFLLFIVAGAILTEIFYFRRKKEPKIQEVSLPSETPLLETIPQNPPSQSFSPPPEKRRLSRKTLTTLFVVSLITISIPVAVALVRQRQEIRKGATEGCPPASCTGNGYLCAGDCACNWEQNKGVRWHYKCVDGKVESYNELDAGCNSACPGGSSPSPTPTSSPGQTCPQGDNGQVGETCSNLNWCDIAGGCNHACCESNGDCPSGQNCDIPNGYCRKGKSCNPAGSGFHKACRDRQCVNVPGAGSDECTSPNQCQATTPTPSASPIPGDKNSYCSVHNYTRVSCSSLPGDFADCETNPASNGACCKDTSNNPFCCWSDGNCSGGQRRGCSEAGSGCIKMLKGTYNVKVCSCPNGRCPCSENCTTISRTWNSDNESQCFFGQGECGQADVIGYCGSCKNTGCGGVTPTPTPTPRVTPTPTPTPRVTPTPTPTPSASCGSCQIYDKNWSPIIDRSTLRVGQVVYLATKGSTNDPQGITKAKFRIKSGAWQETTAKHGDAFYIQHTILTAGSYLIESMVWNPTLGWW